MNSEQLVASLKPHLETAERAVAAVKDPRLREIAFGRILDRLLAGENADPRRRKPSAGGKGPAEKAAKEPATREKGRAGAKGGLRLLMDEGELNAPRSAPEIIDLLKKEGRHYRRDTVLMGLLNLVRERALTRLKEGGDKKWKYVVRR